MVGGGSAKGLISDRGSRPQRVGEGAEYILPEVDEHRRGVGSALHEFDPNRGVGNDEEEESDQLEGVGMEA